MTLGESRRWRRGRYAFPVLALALAGTAPQAPGRATQASDPRPANLVLITVDTLRPDSLGWVSGRQATPAIDRLAREGFAFPAAVSPMPLTFPSHAAMLTAMTPRRLGLRDNGRVLGADVTTLADALRRGGYATGAFVSGYPLAAIFGLDRGFDVYDDKLSAGHEEGELERPASSTTAAARAWLRTARPPWFVWVHYYDPHYPYEPPAAFKRPGPRGAYDGEVAFVDSAVADLRRGVEALASGDTLMVFAADHGESLGEHGEGTHGFFIYDSTVAVPLIFHFPRRISPGRSLAPARLLDIAPTALALLGQRPLPEPEGVSLVPTLAGKSQQIPFAYVETYQPWISYGWSPLTAVRQAGWKLIQAPRPELYDLAKDPGEEHNMIDRNSSTAQQLRGLLREMKPGRSPQGPRLDPEVAERLQALGYTGGGGSDVEPPARGLRDPKDGGALRDLMTEADQHLRRGDNRAAVAKFDSVLAQDPENRFALLRSSSGLLRLGDSRGAIPRLKKLVQLNPDQPEAHEAFAVALGRASQHAAAADQWKEVVRLQPRRAQAWSSMGAALGLSGKREQAVKAFAHAVELQPSDPGFLVRLAFAEHAAGQIEAAATHLGRAASLAGQERFEYPSALGILLLQLGRPDEARRWLKRSRPEEEEFAEARLQLAILEADAGRSVEARRALGEALAKAPELTARAEGDPRLAPLLR